MMEMNNAGIYMITSPSGKSYIGRSLNLKQRLNKYRNKLCKQQVGILHAITKYGWDNMTVTILYSEPRTDTTNDTLNTLEQYYIALHNTLVPAGYNLNTGGNQPVLSEDTKRRIAKAATGRKFSEESKLKMSVAQRRPNVQKIKSLTHRKSVVQYSLTGEYIQEWESLVEIQKNLDFSDSSISNACKNKRQSHGYLWEYKINE